MTGCREPIRSTSLEHCPPQVAPGADPAFQQAMDNQMLQVGQDNVLAVHRAFQQHADDLQRELQRIRQDVQVGHCGGDPVSRDVAASFNGKIGQLLDVHWKHWEELSTVASLLRATARSYGKSEEEIGESLSGATDR